MKLVVVGRGDEMSDLNDIAPLFDLMRISFMAEHRIKRYIVLQ